MNERIKFNDEELLIINKFLKSEMSDEDKHSVVKILEQFGGDIDKLKAYVKWLYKYGGTGSKGNGGAGGSSANWSINGSIDGQLLGSQILLSESSTRRYPIRLSINRPGSDTYLCRIYVDKVDPKHPIAKFTLSAEDNSYDSEITINRDCQIIIEVTNNTESETKQISTPCILYAHNIKCILVDNDNNELSNYSTSTLFYKNLNNGLKLKISHNIYVKADTVKLSLNIIGSKTYDPINITLLDNANNPESNEPITYINLWEILGLNDNTDEDIFGTYVISGELTYNFNGNKSAPIFLNTTIVPDGLYLKVTPIIDRAIIYNNPQENYLDEDNNNVYKFSSKNIYLSLTVYGDSNKYPITITSNGYNLLVGQTFNNGVPTTISIQLNYESTISEHEINFYVAGNESKTFKKYIYLGKEDNSLNWFSNNELNVVYQAYFREKDFYELNVEESKRTNKITLKTLESINRNYMGQGYLQMNMLNGGSSIQLYKETDSRLDTTDKDLLISIGLQYSEVNQITNKIFTLNFNNGSSDSIDVDIYQDGIIIDKNKTEIFIPKEMVFDVREKNKYHLLNILIRNVENKQSSKYEMIIFIDGYIEAAVESYFGTLQKMQLNYINAYEGNYSINLLDVTYCGFEDKSNGIRGINDIDIVQYYYKYKNDYWTTEEITYFQTLKSILSDFEYIDINSQGNITSVIKLNNITNLTQLQSKLTQGSLQHNTPILILQMNYNDSPEKFFTNYFCKDYSQGNLSDSGSIQISNFTIISDTGKVQNYNGSSIFELQGSSTGKYKSKNFTLELENPNGVSNNYVTLFTPNFSHTDPDTFLPENILLFKADAVDSTHANNTSAGLFINKNTTKFSDSRKIHDKVPQYQPYIKNCLLGFPILVFFGLKNLEDSTDENPIYNYYYVGIYNCNLGRDSYLNLGYYDLNTILNNLYETDGVTKVNLLDGEHDGFGAYIVNKEHYIPINDLCVAEIQGGKPYYDFSQFHQHVLFEDNQGREGMFGDFYPKMDNNQLQKNKIQTFVRMVSILGGALFRKLKKNMSNNINDEYGYKDSYNAHYVEGNKHWISRSTGSVPNYTKQFDRNDATFTVDNVSTASFENLLKTIYNVDNLDSIDVTNNNWQDIFRWFIGIFNEDEIVENNSGNKYLYKNTDNFNDPTPKWSHLLDYTSLIEYYTICMAFGLTDSVMKNLNIKSFKETGPFYIAFYDMDTSFSRDNGGDYVHPFAFSDYWGIDNNENVVYRDFYPDTNTAGKASDLGYEIMENDWANIPKGFDIPSSYLFAIAKYAKFFYKNNGDSNYQTNPNYFWYTLRNDGERSELRNAKDFINNYFGINLNKINRIFFNANYRFKYLQKMSLGFETTNLQPFHGRGLYSLEDWLNKRFHILDAYFNIMNIKSNNIQYYDMQENTWKDLTNNEQKIYDPLFNEVAPINSISRNNTDIYLTRSIFEQNGSIKNDYSGGQIGTIYMHTLDYSPMHIEWPNSNDQFICIDSNKEYSFTEPPESGNSSISFGGSIAWTNVRSFNTLISNRTLSINSPYIENITVNSNPLTTLNLINIPSVTSINITSKEAQCDISLLNQQGDTENKYPNLRTINISNSQCGLQVNGLDITTIIADNMNAPDKTIIVENCDNLRVCSFSNTILKTLSISSIWGDNIIISNSQIGNILVQNSKFEHASIQIVNNGSLTDLELDGFETVIIEQCQNLKKIVLNDIGNYKLKNIQINNCCNFNRDGNITFNICGKSSYPDLNNPGNIIVDLSSCLELNEISFNSTEYISEIILPDKEEITLLPFAFANTNLTNIIYQNNINQHYLCLVDNKNIESDITKRNCHIFYNSRLDYTGPSDYKFRVKEPNTSLKSIFEIESPSGDGHRGSSNLTYTDLYNIIYNLDGKENVVSLERAFLRQTSIEYKYDASTNLYYNSLMPEGINKHLSLDGFTNLSICDEMLWGTSYNVFDNYLFNSDNIASSNNNLSILGIIGLSLVYIHKDALKYIKNKITQFLYSIDKSDDNNRSYIAYDNPLFIYDDENDGVLSEANVHNFLYDDISSKYITTLCGVNFQNQYTNLNNLFTSNQSKVNIIVNSFNNLHQGNPSMIDKPSRMSYSKGFNNIGLSNVSENLSLYKSFVSYDLNVQDIYRIINVEELVDLTSFISFNNQQYKNITNNLKNYTIANENIFNFYKTYEYDKNDYLPESNSNWYIFWTKLISSGVLNIDYLFNKTIFKFNSSSDEDTTILLPNHINFAQVNSAYSLFSLCTGFNKITNEECGIRISNIDNTNNIIKQLTNLTSLSYMFEGTTFNGINSYPIPNNLLKGLTRVEKLNYMFSKVKIKGNNRTYNSGTSHTIYNKKLLYGTDTNLNLQVSNYSINAYGLTDTVGYPIIPEGLFNNIRENGNNNIKEVTGMFIDSEFEGYLPSNLFEKSKQINKIDNIFNNCKILPQLLTEIPKEISNNKIYNLSTEQNTKIYSIFPENFIQLTPSINSLNIFSVYVYVGDDNLNRIYLFNDKTFTGSNNQIVINNFNISISNESNIIGKYITNEAGNSAAYFDVYTLRENGNYPLIFNICFNYNNSTNPTDYSEGLKYNNTSLISFKSLSGGNILSPEMCEIYYGYVLEHNTILNNENYFIGYKPQYIASIMRLIKNDYNSNDMRYPNYSKYLILPSIIKLDNINTQMFPTKYYNENYNQVKNTQKYTYIYNINNPITLMTNNIDIDDNNYTDIEIESYIQEDITKYRAVINFGNNSYIYKEEIESNTLTEQLRNEIINRGKIAYRNLIYYNYLLLFNSWLTDSPVPIDVNTKKGLIHPYFSLNLKDSETENMILVVANDTTMKQNYTCTLEYRAGTDTLYISSIT